MKHQRLSALAIAFLMITGVMAVASHATAWGEIDEESIFETVEDYDGDGKINYLVITVPVQNISWYGDPFYRDYIAIHAELWDDTDTVYVGVCDAERDIESDSEDNLTVQVKISGRMINASEVDGPYLVKMWVGHLVEYHYYPSMPIVSESLGYFEYVTEGYAHDEFETPDPYTISSIDWEVVDDDENGLHDWLRVNLTVNATDDDIVEISLELSEETGPDLIIHSDERDLVAGYNQTICVDIDGRLMNGLAREDTWYWIYISVATLDGFKDDGWVSTDSLNGSDFEEYVISVVDGPVWTMVDVNDDGLHDFLRVSFNTTVQETLKYRLRMRLNDENSYWTPTQYFDGYLLEGFEETVVAYFDVSDMFDYASTGPFNLEIHEYPATTYNKWPGYDYIGAIFLDNITIEELDIEQPNHPDTIFVSGYITDEEGGPIAGAEVYALARDSWDGYAIDFSTTDIDGMYNLTELIPGLIMISVQAVGYFNETFYTNEIVSNTTDFNLTLEPNSPADTTIWGTVFDIEGDPVADAIVALLRPGSGVASQTTSNETGDYSLDIRAGDYVIEAVYQDLGIGSSTVSIGLTFQWVSLPQGSSINNDITLNITYDGDIEDIYDLDMSRSLWFESWDSLSMRSDLTQNQENDILSFLYAVIADVDFGNADGYVDEEENAFIQSMYGGLYSIFMGEPQSTSRCEWYTLDSFSVDGIGYLAQPDDVQLTSFDLTGSVWETEQEFSMRLDVVDLVPHWPIPEDETHELYLEVEYASEIPLSLTYTNRYYITAPEGFILNSTNEPENIEIDGLNHVTIVPGDSPDQDNVSSALVVLEFRRETGPWVGSVHGVALLQGETDHAGIEIALHDQNLAILDQMTTGSTGEFAFPDLEPNSYWVRANFSGYIDVYAEVTVTSEEIAEVNLELLPVGSTVDLGGIYGRVVTQAELPLEGATIGLHSPVDDATPVMTETVGADGAFEFSDLESGEFKLEISADGFDNRSICVMLNTGEVTDLGDIELLSDMPVGYITGILESSDNESIVEATVEVRASGLDTVLADGETNSDGVFLITGIEDGDYNLTFVLNGEIIGYGDVTVDDFVGDAGVIEIDLSDADIQGDEESMWPLILLLAAMAIVAVIAAVVLKLRKPKNPHPTAMVEGEEPPAVQE